MRPYFRLFAATALAGCLLPGTGRADTLDWSTVNYAPTPSDSLQPTAVSTVNGTTTYVEFGDDGYFSTYVPSPASGTYASSTSANQNAIYANGGTTGSYGLQVVADFTNSSNISSSGSFIGGASIPVTISFSRPVMNVGFTFYDVDSGTISGGVYTDYVSNIFGLGTGGATVAPVTLTPGATNTVSGSGFLATGNNNQNADGGNASVQFDSTPITQFSFVYTDTAAANSSHSVIQIIALGNIDYTPTPEPSTWAMLGLAAVGAYPLYRRRLAARR